MSTSHPHSTTIAPDQEHGDHAMFLDGAVIGYARTAHEARTLLDQLIHDRSALPLPPRDAVAETLQVLAAHDDNPAIYLDAAAQLLAGVTIAACGPDRLLNGVLGRICKLSAISPWKAPDDLSDENRASGPTIAEFVGLCRYALVRRAPPQESWPWPWRCACGDARCWHGALPEGVLFA